MFRRIEAKNYRCLKEISQPLNPFEILVGANASGKSTFLDVLGFLRDFVEEGLRTAVERRTENFHDLVWGREGGIFHLAIEAALPERMQEIQRISYGISVHLDTVSDELGVNAERVATFPDLSAYTVDIGRADTGGSFLAQLVRQDSHRGRLKDESFLLKNAPEKSGPDPSVWLRDLLGKGVRTVVLDAEDLQKPSPPGRGDPRKITGATLPRTIAQLADKHPARFRDWLSHVRTALPDILTIDSVLQEWDNHRYLMIHYENGVRVPSWMLSEGTLRLLALTILAYLPDFHGVYLVEEPENGVHPTALETIYQSLSSVYDAQVLVATHSPILLNMASPDQILCFSKTAEGAKIVRGTDHPALQEWRKEVSLGTLAASGILG